MPKGFLRTVLALTAALAGGVATADDAKLVKRSYPVGEFVASFRPDPTPPSPPQLVPPPLAVAVVHAAPLAVTAPTPLPVRHLPPETRRNAEALGRLMVNMVKPYSWAGMGGAGSVAFDEASCSLVVTQTADVHAHVADLIASMRRVQMASMPMVQLEIKAVEVPEAFFESAGVDADVVVRTTGGMSVPTPACPEGEACRVMKAVHAADGAKPAMVGLSDAQVQCLMKCVQADPRASVLACPRLMLADAQMGFFQVGEAVPVMTEPELTAGPNGVDRKPQVQMSQVGTAIRATPKVSADRRFVQLRLNYQTMQPNTVAMKVGEGPEAEVITTPVFDRQEIEAAVVIPAGKTVLLAGPVVTRKQVVVSHPVLPQVPYVYRLVTMTRETRPVKCRHLLLVTAKVVTQQSDCCPPSACKVAASPAADCKACPAACETVAVAKPARPADTEATRLVAAYHKACADGRSEDALRLAMQALSRDPNCFATEK